jgi:hypothetical protein
VLKGKSEREYGDLKTKLAADLEIFLTMAEETDETHEKTLHTGTLLLHCCYTVVTLLLHCCYTVVTLLLHCCYTVVTMLLHCCYTVPTLITLLLHRCHTIVAPHDNTLHTATGQAAAESSHLKKQIEDLGQTTTEVLSH